jgi:hypothetical protein
MLMSLFWLDFPEACYRVFWLSSLMPCFKFCVDVTFNIDNKCASIHLYRSELLFRILSENNCWYRYVLTYTVHTWPTNGFGNRSPVSGHKTLILQYYQIFFCWKRITLKFCQSRLCISVRFVKNTRLPDVVNTENFSSWRSETLILILLTWRIWWAPNNASKWQMGFSSAFRGLKSIIKFGFQHSHIFWLVCEPYIWLMQIKWFLYLQM